MPYSIRQPVKELKDIRMENEVAVLPFKMVVRKDISEALAKLKPQFKYLKNSLDPFGYLNVFRLSVNLPFTLPRIGVDYISDKYTLVWSNINASKKCFIYNGRKSIG